MNRARPIRVLLCSLLLIITPCTDVGAWHDEGHVKATELALTLLREKMPSFFIEGGSTITHCCQDPDLFSAVPMPQLTRMEKPEHYIDLERLGNRPLPGNRYEYLDLCRELHQDPSDVGLLPYAVAEWTQRLTIALAEHRRWPENPDIHKKCLVFAGILAHYAGDASQPLHLTVHHDGRVGPSGQSPRTGIHMKVDALLGKLKADDKDLLTGLTATAHPDPMTFVLAEIEKNRALVDMIYRLESRLPDVQQPLGNDPELVAFTTERMRSTTQIISCVFLSAWQNSASVQLPKWHKRPEATQSEHECSRAAGGPVAAQCVLP